MLPTAPRGTLEVEPLLPSLVTPAELAPSPADAALGESGAEARS